MAEDLTGKVAIVTGAARGIGRAIAIELGNAGANVVLADLGDRKKGAAYELAGSEELEATTSDVAKLGVQAKAVVCDVTSAADCERMVAETIAAFGQLDLLVNNAGVVYFKPMQELEEAQWDLLFDVNVKGVFLCSRAAIPALAETQGSIVNMSSIAGTVGAPQGSAYCGTKWAVIGITQSLAAELGPQGIRVNAVCPGVVSTHMWTDHILSEEPDREAAYDDIVRRMIPLRREQKPEDIAEAVVYLATAHNVSGVSLKVTGGY